MERLVVACALGALAVSVAWITNRWGPGRSRAIEYRPPTGWSVPTFVDRGDFAVADSAWLLAVFTSATCASCADTLSKAQVLESGAVKVVDIEATEQSALHQKYRIEAVPVVLVVTPSGAVAKWFFGPPTAADLWAAVAEARDGTVAREPD